MKKVFKGWGFYLILLILIFAIYSFVSVPETKTEYVFSDLVTKLENKEITKLEIKDEMFATVEFTDGTRAEISVPSYEALYEAAGDSIKAQIAEGTLVVSTPAPVEVPWWLSMLPSLLLGAVILVFWVMMFRQNSGGKGGVMSFGKTKPKVLDDKNKKTFADVAGADEEKEELEEIVEFLKNPTKFNSLGARIPKGVLLVGPPGTGKTLLAKAVAGEAGVPFFSISGSDFVEMFVGVGASRVRDLFEQAKKNAPCIVFIDEIDAVGRQRGAGLGGGNDEREQTLNQLLVEMDGFGINQGVIVIAATNRPDILDSALLRPGRFDRQVYVSHPDIKGREEILKVHTRNKPLHEDVDFKTLAQTTVGFTGADLENLSNEAALKAAKAGKKSIKMEDFEDSFMKVIAGPEKKSKVVIEKERKLTAYHEAGHAVATKFLSTQDRVHQVSIIPRGRAGGYTLSLPKEDLSFRTKTEMLEEIVSLLGGRVSEALMLGDISTGASNDIQRATTIAKELITRYGMSDNLGSRSFGDANDEVFIGRDFSRTVPYSEATAAKIDEEIKSIIDEAYKHCETILNEHKDELIKVAELLLEKEKIDGDEFEAIFTPAQVEVNETIEETVEETDTTEEN